MAQPTMLNENTISSTTRRTTTPGTNDEGKIKCLYCYNWVLPCDVARVNDLIVQCRECLEALDRFRDIMLSLWSGEKGRPSTEEELEELILYHQRRVEKEERALMGDEAYEKQRKFSNYERVSKTRRKVKSHLKKKQEVRVRSMKEDSTYRIPVCRSAVRSNKKHLTDG